MPTAAQEDVTPQSASSDVLSSELLSQATLPNGRRLWQVNQHETDFLFSEIYEQQTYFQHGIHLSEKAVVFDIGANIGMFTLAAKQRCPSARVFAFEPSPIAAEALRRNVRDWPDAQVLECGVTSGCTTSVLRFYPGYTILSGFHAEEESDVALLKASMKAQAPRDDAPAVLKAAAERASDLLARQKLTQHVDVECRMVSISSVLDEQKLPGINLLKIDAERAELDILAGIRDEHWPGIEQIVMEVHDQDGTVLPSVLAILDLRGFDVIVEQDSPDAASGLFNVYARQKC